MPAPVLRPLSVGEMLDTAFGLYRELFGTLVLISVWCSGVPMLLSVYLDSAGGPTARPLLWLLNLMLSVLLGTLATAASVQAISGVYLGRPLGAGEALRRSLPLVGQLIVLSVLVSLVVGLGFLALIVPGMIFVSALLVSTPALVLEPGIGATAAMSRSWSLTKGSRWRMLALVSVFGVLLLVVSTGLGVVAALALGAGGVGRDLSTNLVTLVLVGSINLVLYPILYSLLTVAYYDLRIRKEGFDLELLASALPGE